MNPPRERIPGLDFAKGALVLIMVLYHWMNYFLVTTELAFRYLRFLTPSFIFIAGLLVGCVYLPRYDGTRRVPARLASRGAKLLALVVLLNVTGGALQGGPLGSINRGFFQGTQPAAFTVLVPISYLLLASAALLPLWARYRWVTGLMTVALLGTAWVCERWYIDAGYLDVFSIGMTGISVGQIYPGQLNRWLKNPIPILLSYGLYAGAAAIWNVVFAIQVIGVFVNVAVLCWMGEISKNRAAGRLLSRLGGYSLFAYIAQIAILQVLRRGAGFEPGWETAAGSLAACAILTVLCVEVLDHMRRRIETVSKLYGVVFA